MTAGVKPQSGSSGRLSPALSQSMVLFLSPFPRAVPTLKIGKAKMIYRVHMSKSQRGILTLGALVILVMILFPPRSVSYGQYGGYQSAGYHFLFQTSYGHVNASVLSVQIIATAIIAWLIAQLLKPNT
jgi:hypothetical protein